MKQSKFLKLNGRDFINGLFLSVLVAGIKTIWPALNTWFRSDTWAIDLNVMVTVKLMTEVFAGYLLKNLITPENKSLFALIFGGSNPLRDEEINWIELIQNCLSLDDLGDLEELPYEYYHYWCDKYTELGLGNNYPSYEEIRAGSVGTSGPKK